MLLAVLWWALLATPETPPTLASIKGLRPAVVGELVLRGRDHGIIESVVPDPGLDPTGYVKLTLTERPSNILGGCLRRKWTASFQAKPGAPKSTAQLSDAFEVFEVSLPKGSSCPDGEFTHVNPGLAVEHALRALQHLQSIRTGKARIRFSCSDDTGSGLCQTSEVIRQELTKLPAWAVTESNGHTEFWLGVRGEVVTAVSYSETTPDRVRVERRVPAPF